MKRRLFGIALAGAVLATVFGLAPTASATPVCTDGYMGGPPLAACGDRIFPEAALARSYVQYQPDPAGFLEYRHGIEFLAQKYPSWIEVYTLNDHYETDLAVSAGPDEIRSYEDEDSGDGRDIWIIEITDQEVDNADKEALFFSLSVHGNERGGLEGGLRTAEDLAMAAEGGGAIVDGYDNYDSTTGRAPEFHSYEVAELLQDQVIYLSAFNVDGWAQGDLHNKPAPNTYARGNSLGTDLNRQMPTVGRINRNRNPLQESEMFWGTKFMHEVAEAAGGLMAYGADVHGELTSRAYVDIMYPAGQFDSVDHRRLMAIAERTKSVIDETLYAGIQNQIEEGMGGNEHEGIEEYHSSIPKNAVHTKPAHWATVWDTLGYTDTGFIGDYLATDLGVTGMDYEIAFNHTVPEKVWNVYQQENHINATRAIIKTAMAYAVTQEDEFNDENFQIDTLGQVGYIFNPRLVTPADENGPGTLPGPERDGVGNDGKPVEQRDYSATNMRFFDDTDRLVPNGFEKLNPAAIAASPSYLDRVDSLVLADIALPEDASGEAVDPASYFGNLRSWVEKGGNLILTDKALHALADLGVVPTEAVVDINVYQPYANIQDFDHTMVEGLRKNARQLVEAPALGYEIGNNASPMTIVDLATWEAAGGHTIGTTGNNSGSSDDLTQTSVGELPLGDGFIKILGGALPTPTEENDHRFGLRDYALTYSGLYIIENSITYDAPGLGVDAIWDEESTESHISLRPDVI